VRPGRAGQTAGVSPFQSADRCGRVITTARNKGRAFDRLPALGTASEVGGLPLLPIVIAGLLVVASQPVERLNQHRRLDVLACKVGILEVLPEVLLERQVVTHGSRTLALDGRAFAVVAFWKIVERSSAPGGGTNNMGTASGPRGRGW
jgi:hypothetical protein